MTFTDQLELSAGRGKQKKTCWLQEFMGSLLLTPNITGKGLFWFFRHLKVRVSPKKPLQWAVFQMPTYFVILNAFLIDKCSVFMSPLSQPINFIRVNLTKTYPPFCILKLFSWELSLFSPKMFITVMLKMSFYLNYKL